jgi:hypothetical protein
VALHRARVIVVVPDDVAIAHAERTARIDPIRDLKEAVAYPSELTRCEPGLKAALDLLAVYSSVRLDDLPSYCPKRGLTMLAKRDPN